MEILCPHCQSPVDVAKPSSGETICPSCGSSINLVPGTTTGWSPDSTQRRVGKFELLDRVGIGSFGTVYKARDVELDRIVAIKVPRAGNLGSTPSDADRFIREARSVAQLRHPSIVSIHEVGQHDGLPFLVEDFVEGLTLADLITGERLSPRQSADLVAQMADALQYAHDRGVVHRDVKPSNVMLERGGKFQKTASSTTASVLAGGAAPPSLSPRIMDFGLAKREGVDGTMTAEGQVLGTPAYMSPEQARGDSHKVDGRSDVYSLGVILYELLTGALPFKGNQRFLQDQVLHAEPKPPRQRDASVPRDLETICLKAMAKDPARRYQAAREFAADLRRYLGGEPVLARPAGPLERAVKWVKRSPTAAGLAASLCLTLVVGAALGGWFWHRAERERLAAEARQREEEEARELKVGYFNTFVKRHGVPEGIGPLSAEAAARRTQVYRLSHRHGRLEKLELLNGSGYPENAASAMGPITAGRSRGASAFTYGYDASGRLSDETAHNHVGQVVWRFHYTTPDTGHYTDQRGFPRAHAATGATYVSFAWTPDGFEEEVRFLDARGRPKPDSQGVFGIRYERDERGLALKTTYLNRNGRPTYSKGRIAGWTAKFDALGNAVEKSYFAPDGSPALHLSLGARTVYQFDAWGNEARVEFHGLHGEPFLNKSGVAATQHTLDERGNVIELAFFGTDGRPILGRSCVAVARQRHDERGNVVERAFLGTRGEPVLHRDRAHRFTARFDEHGNEVERTFYGLDGRPTRTKSGFARQTSSFDDRGNEVEAAYFSPDGPESLIDVPYLRVLRKFDEDGNVVEVATFGRDGAPTVAGGAGAARVTYQYDDRGNVVEEARFGPGGQPMATRFGYFRKTMAYDDLGNRIEQSFFGVDGQPAVEEASDVARIESKYDERGFEVERRLFGLDGKPVIHRTERYARLDRVLDDRGNVLEWRYYGVAGEPVPDKYGAARTTQAYDARGNWIEWASYGTDGKPVLSRDGWARTKRKYNERGELTEWTCFDGEGRPIPCKWGYARTTHAHDNRGNQVEWSCFGTDGKPILYVGGFATSRWTYDVRGNLVEWACFDVAGKPVLSKYGYARSTATYDERDWAVDVVCFDVAGKPVPTEVAVESLAKGGVAERVGLSVGDVLVAYGGWGVKSKAAFLDRLGVALVPQELVVRRKQTTLGVQLPPGELGAELVPIAVGAALPTLPTESTPPDANDH